MIRAILPARINPVMRECSFHFFFISWKPNLFLFVLIFPFFVLLVRCRTNEGDGHDTIEGGNDSFFKFPALVEI